MEQINLSIDCLVLGFSDDQKLKALLIKKIINEDNDLQYALPGDLVGYDEDLNTASKRILKNLTSLSDVFLKQFYTFGNPNRTKHKKDQDWLNIYRKRPKERVVTIGYMALVKMEDYKPGPSSFAFEVEWVSIDDVPKNMAFDHNIILNKGIEFLRNQMNNEFISNLLPRKFTLSQLQNLHEIILNQKLDKRNFRKNILKVENIKRTEERQEGVPHKPAFLYQFSKN